MLIIFLLYKKIQMHNNKAPKMYLITGATGCLGRALALQITRQQAQQPLRAPIQLILHGRQQQSLIELDDHLQSIATINTVLWPLDFLQATKQSIQSACQELEMALQDIKTTGINAVFNCALASGEQVPILNETQASWSDVMQVNVATPRLILKELLPLLEKAPQASIFFFDDKASTTLYQGAFAMSKIMLHHLTAQLNSEFEKINQISSTVLKLDPFDSPLRTKCFPGEGVSIIHTEVASIASQILKKIENQ